MQIKSINIDCHFNDNGINSKPSAIFCSNHSTLLFLVSVVTLFDEESMMKLRATCQLDYHFSQPTPAVFLLRPQSGLAQQITQEEWQVTPPLPVTSYNDNFGNLCDRVLFPMGDYQVSLTVELCTSEWIDVAPGMPKTPIEQLPSDTMVYLLPSRYCLPEFLLQEAQMITQDFADGYDKAAAICTYIHQSFTYQYGSSTAETTALDTWQHKKGVCRDFAHLGISLSRALDMPARMVVGYLYQLDPMDLHAWYEVFIGDRWYTFDATQSAPKGGRAILGYGRDAADVAFATFFAPFELKDMKVNVEKID